MKRTFPIKKACVSANVEILREEIPIIPVTTYQNEVYPTCKKCQNERNRNREQKNKQKVKKKQGRANTPIIIQLKDTLRAAIRQKPKSRQECLRKQESLETKDEADTETDNSSDRGETIEILGRNRRKNVKNLSALIDVVDKPHKKDMTVNVHCNLSSDNPCNEKLVAEYVLNNAQNTKTSGKFGPKKSIVECENVEVICNDLNSVESNMEDMEESEISSTTSSSEIQSDSDASNFHESNNSGEFTAEELQTLAAYTAGCPLIRYDCPPSACPQCRAYTSGPCHYQSNYYHKSKTAQNTHQKRSSKKHFRQPHASHSCRVGHLKPVAHQNHPVPLCSKPKPKTVSVEVENISNTESETDEVTDTPSEASADTDNSLTDIASPVSKTRGFSWSERSTSRRHKPHKQLLDIGIAGKYKKHSKNGLRNDFYMDSVFVDLTGTDVTFTVYYHHDLTDNDPMCKSYAQSMSQLLGNQHHHHHHRNSMDFVPYYSGLPYYHQYMYWSSYCTPFYNPLPFYLQLEDLLPKTAMVPPSELDKFTATQPPQRQWIPLSRPDTGRPAAIFTVMCYNVLCDKYCTRTQYGYCPSWALNWEYRKKGIMDEIKTCSADIIGLQEVETDQFYHFFKPELERDGYQGIFSPKSRARTMTEQERKHVDGCAIFFKTSKFSLVKEHLIEFNQLAMASAEGHDEMLNRVMTKDNIGLAALLETREGVFDSGGGLPPEGQIKQPILVTTAHMHWDPEFSDVKLIQTMMLMSEIKRIVDESVRTFRPETSPSQPVDCNAIPMILCGDLNSLPDSGVIEYLSTGRVSSNHIDFKELGYEACLQSFNCHKDATQLTHNFRLQKAYQNDIMANTNYTFEFKGIIDYIFFSRPYMNLLGLLGPIDENWFHENKVVGCPHPHIPSDHFALFVEFEMPVPYPELNSILADSRTSSSSTSSIPTSSNSSNSKPTSGRDNNSALAKLR